MNEKDLVKNMLETSFQHTHNISMTGGTDKLRYRLIIRLLFLLSAMVSLKIRMGLFII